MLWAHFGPWFGFLAAHHESICILGGKVSWKLKIISLHGKWGEKLMRKLIPRLIGALSRAWRREKRRGFEDWMFGTIKEEKIRIGSGFFFFLREKILWIFLGDLRRDFWKGFCSWLIWGCGGSWSYLCHTLHTTRKESNLEAKQISAWGEHNLVSVNCGFLYVISFLIALFSL